MAIGPPDEFPMCADRHEIHSAAGIIMALQAYGSAMMPRGIVTGSVFVWEFHIIPAIRFLYGQACASAALWRDKGLPDFPSFK